jgi:hypothetical protein
MPTSAAPTFADDGIQSDKMTNSPVALTPKLTGPKQQHYLPECYLKGFQSKGGVAVFDRRTGDIRRQPTHGTAKSAHLYTFEDAEGRRRYDLEHLFARIESGFADAITKLDASTKLSATDLEYLLCFIAFAELRTPGAIEDAKMVKAEFIRTLGHATTGTPEKAYATLKRMYRDKGEAVAEPELRRKADDLARFVRAGQYDIVVDEKAALMESIRLWEPLAKALWEKDIRIVRAEAGSQYITCDSPVILDTLSGGDVGFGLPDALILFPLTSRYVIALSGGQQRFGLGTASARQVAEMNAVIAQNAFRYIVGPDEEEIRTLTGVLRLAGTQRRPRYETRMLELPDRTIGYVKRLVSHRRGAKRGNSRRR